MFSSSGLNYYSQYLRYTELIDYLDEFEVFSDDDSVDECSNSILIDKNDDEEEADGKEQLENDGEEFTKYSDEGMEYDGHTKIKKEKVDIEDHYRGLNNTPNPLEAMTDQEVLKEYKISKKTIIEFVELIKNDVMCQSNRGRPISPLMHFLITLKYLVTGTTQKQAMSGVSQSTTSRIITRITQLIAQHHDKYIKMPTKDEAQMVKLDFFHHGKFPEVVGCIGSTHVGVKVEKTKEENPSHVFDFRNEHGYHSLRVQIIVGPNGQIYDLDTRYPGSVHENYIFSMSEVNKNQTAQQLQGVFIGSDAYNPTTSIMTTISNPQTTADYYYNEALQKTYTLFYNTINKLKRRFHCLQVFLLCRFATQQNIITSCAIIHNVALRNNDYLLPEDEQADITQPSGNKMHAKRIEIPVVDNNALYERDMFIRKHFPTYYSNQSSSYLYI